MCSPEEDYETWMLVVTSLIDDLDSFSNVFSDLQRCLTSIRETGKLFSPLEARTDDFLKSLSREIVPRIIQLNSLSDDHVLILFEVLQSILAFTLYGFEHKNTDILDVAIRILSEKDNNLNTYNKDFSIVETMRGFYSSEQGTVICLKTIVENDESTALLSKAAQIYYLCREYVDDYAINTFNKQLCDAIMQLAEKDIRKLDEDQLNSLYEPLFNDILKTDPLDQEFASYWLKIFSLLVKSEILKKQIFGLQQIKKIIDDEKLATTIEEFFKSEQNVKDILSCITTYNNGFSQYLGKIYGYCLSKGFIDFKEIEKLWKLEQFRHNTEIQEFFEIFDNLSMYVPATLCVEYSNLILCPHERSEPWMNMIIGVISQFGDKDETYPGCTPLKKAILEICYDNLSPLNSKAKGNMSSSISKGIKDEETDSVLLEIFDRMDKDNMEFSLMIIRRILNTKTIQTEEVKTKITDFCFKEIESKEHKVAIASIIVVLVSNQSVKLTKEQNEKIFSIDDNKDIIISLIKAKSVDEEYIEHYINNIAKNDMSLYSIIKAYVFTANNYNEDVKYSVTSLPFQKEDILWNFALKAGDNYTYYCHLLCKMYQNNIPAYLSDATVINNFLSKWKSFVPITKETKNLLDLLHTFVVTFEDDVDVGRWGVKRHQEKTKSFIFSHVQGLIVTRKLSFGFPSDTKIMVVRQKIAYELNRSPSSFSMFCNGKEMDNSVFLEYYASGNMFIKIRSIDIFVNDLPVEKQVFIPVRTIIPTVVISDSPIMEILFDFLNKNEIEAKYMMNLLNTSSACLLKIEAIKHLKNVKYEELFQRKSYFTFSYMLETLQIYGIGNIYDDLVRTGFFDFLLEQLVLLRRQRLIIKIIDFLKDYLKEDTIKLNYQKLLSTLIPLAIINISSEKREISTTSFSFLEKIANQISKDKTISFPPPTGEDCKTLEIFTALSTEEPPKVTEGAQTDPLPSPPPKRSSSDDYKSFVISCKKFFGDVKLELPALLCNLISVCLLSNVSGIREACSKFLIPLNIPISYFSNFLTKIDNDNFSTFFSAMTPHMTTSDTALVNYVFKSLDVSNSSFKFVLKIINTMLKNNILGEEDKEHIFNFISYSFLNFDIDGYEVALLDDAFTILGYAPADFICPLIEEYTAKIVPFTEYRINGNEYGKKVATPGLRNLGNTCFWNSTLQQFFAIPALRKTIINYSGDDEFIIELKNLFSQMRESGVKALNPTALADKWVTWDGTKLDVHKQQDASDFSQMLIDKLEGIGIDKMFKGSLIHSFDGISTEYHSEQKEIYTMLGLSLNKAKNIEEALDSLHNPDFFVGDSQYQAEGIGKIDAKKTTYIDSLPPHLIIQLRRFEFDVNTWIRKKVDSQVEFPFQIDLSKHCYDKSEPQKYNLDGIIIHSGTVNGGHYYSFIKRGEEWFEYNDSTVKKIDEKYLKEKSFGSTKGVSAFVLFFTKEGVEEIDDSEIPENIKDVISKESTQNMQCRLFCSSSYYQMMLQLSKSKDVKIQSLVVKYLLTIFPHTIHYDKTNLLIEEIKKTENKEQFYSIICNTPLVEALIKCPYNKMKDNLADFIIEISNDFKDTRLIENLWSFFEESAKDIREANSYYSLLSTIVKENKEARNFAAEIHLGERLAKIFQEDIPNYLNENPKVNARFFYKNVNLGSLFVIMDQLEHTETFNNILVQEDFLKMLIESGGKPIVYMKCYKEEHFPFLMQFFEKNSILLNMAKSYVAILSALQEKAFSFLQSLKFKVAGKLQQPMDVSFSYVCASRVPELKELLIKNLDQWLKPQLFSNDLKARIEVIFSLQEWVPHKSFSEINIMMLFNDKEFDQSDFNVTLNDKLTNEQMETAKELMNWAYTQFNDIVEYVRSQNYPAMEKVEDKGKFGMREMLRVIMFLKRVVVNVDIEKFKDLARKIVPISFPYDPNIWFMLEYLKDEEMEDQFYYDIVLNLEGKSYTHYLFAFELFEFLMPKLKARNLPESVIESLLRSFAFSAVFEAFDDSYKKIVKEILEMCVNKNKEYVLKLLDERLKEIATVNISSVILILEQAGEKRSILDNIILNCGGNQLLTLDEIISKGFSVNNQETTENLIQVTWFLNTRVITPESKKFIWDFLFKNQLTAQVFLSNCFDQDDWKEQAEYLIRFDEDIIIPKLLECAQKSLDAMKIAFDVLVSKALSLFTDPQYVSVVQKLKINNQASTYAKYIKLVYPNANKTELAEIIGEPIYHLRYLIDFLNMLLDYPLENHKIDFDKHIKPYIGDIEAISILKPELGLLANQVSDLVNKLRDGRSLNLLNIPEGFDLAKIIENCIIE